MRNRNSLILGAVFVAALVIVGAATRNKPQDIVDVDISLDDLDNLGSQIDELSFEDLGGLSDSNSSLGLSLDELDALGDILQDLEFDDLEGLSEN